MVAVASGDKPTLGLMIVPITGPIVNSAELACAINAELRTHDTY